jgi:hypothetical protein
MKDGEDSMIDQLYSKTEKLLLVAFGRSSSCITSLWAIDDDLRVTGRRSGHLYTTVMEGTNDSTFR